jgi:hypothetical protein
MTRPFAAFALALCLSTSHAADEVKGDIKPAAPAEPQVSVKGAKSEEATKAKLRADALLARCVIKPVMTDEEISLCKQAYQASDQAQKQK